MFNVGQTYATTVGIRFPSGSVHSSFNTIRWTPDFEWPMLTFALAYLYQVWAHRAFVRTRARV